MSAFSDARTVPSGSVIETDLAIIGGGPAGITLALTLADKPIRILILESGGTDFDDKTQRLYDGTETGVRYRRHWSRRGRSTSKANISNGSTSMALR